MQRSAQNRVTQNPPANNKLRRSASTSDSVMLLRLCLSTSGRKKNAQKNTTITNFHLLHCYIYECLQCFQCSVFSQVHNTKLCSSLYIYSLCIQTLQYLKEQMLDFSFEPKPLRTPQQPQNNILLNISLHLCLILQGSESLRKQG